MNENKKKIAFIINPISGTQSKEQILKWLDEKLDKERYAQEVIYTERNRDFFHTHASMIH